MTEPFLGLDLAPLAVSDQGWMTELLERDPQPLSDYSFASLMAWATIFTYRRVPFGPGTLLLSCVVPGTGRPRLLQPVGDFPDELQQLLLTRGRALPSPLEIGSVSEAFLARYPAFAAHFDVSDSRDSADYIYSATDLADLPGRRYQPKRNLVAQASRAYRWTVEPLAPEHRDACLEVSDDIAAKRAGETVVVTLAQETIALERALELIGPLQLRGLLLRVEGRPAAFMIADRLGPDLAVVLFERAVRSYKGLYQVINQETARVAVARGRKFIDREEDLGDPGLRQAKLSYHPVRLSGGSR